MRLIVTIDTEEDNWLPYSQTGYTTENAGRIPRLHELFSDLGVRPTYLVTYQMASNRNSAAILREIHQDGSCEIGAHCHPWSQPPHEEQQVIENSMLFNLPDELQFRKIEYLHRTIQSQLGITPTAFRSGRWGYGQAVGSTLHSLGYEVDSSICAHTDWTYSYGPDSSDVLPAPYRFSPPDIYRSNENGVMLEVPASVSYLQSNVALSHAVFEGVRRSPLKSLRLLGILSRMRLLNKVSLTPEISSVAEMVALVERMRKQGHQVATMWFHSSILLPGCTPYVKTEKDARDFLEKIRLFLTQVNGMSIRNITLSEAQLLFPRRSAGTSTGTTHRDRVDANPV